MPERMALSEIIEEWLELAADIALAVLAIPLVIAGCIAMAPFYGAAWIYRRLVLERNHA